MNLYNKGKKALVALASRDRCWLRALRFGVAPSIEHLPVLRLIQVTTVVDIGANRGQFALAARHCFPQAIIHSFEPLSMPAAIFRRIFFGDHRIRLYESAIGEESGNRPIHISAKDDSSSLLQIGSEQERIYPGTAEVRSESIRVTRLIDVITQSDLSGVSLLKLDVQGFELHCLKGCGELLAYFSWVYCECSFIELYKEQALAYEVIQWLCERHFVLTGIYNVSYDSRGQAIQADFLFRKLNSMGK